MWSLKDTDGMQCYWTRFGDLPNQNFGRHITNTYTWMQENTTTITELEFCWIRNGVITTMIVANHQSIMLVSVYFLHSGYADHHIEKCTEQLRSTRVPAERAYRLLEETSTPIWGLGFGVERVSVGPHTFKEGSKRGDWLKQWLMIQNFTALNTMYRNAWKANDPQISYRDRATNRLHLDQEKTPEIH